MKNKLIGIIFLVLIIAGAVVYQQFFNAPKTVVLKGYVGGEKMTFLENPEVQNILRKEYGIEINPTKAGSIEMVKETPAPDIDFLWPSSQVALELFKMNQYKLVKSEIIFNSPIVLYSWDIVTDALIKEGIVEKIEESYYVVNFPKLLTSILRTVLK